MSEQAKWKVKKTHSMRRFGAEEKESERCLMVQDGKKRSGERTVSCKVVTASDTLTEQTHTVPEYSVDFTDGGLSRDDPAGALPGRCDPLVLWAMEEEVVGAFEKCLEEVACLQRRRDALVQEFLAEEAPMQESVQTLRLQLVQAHSRLAHAQLHKQRMQEEVMLVKRKLFAVTRDCIQSQVAMAARQYEVAQFAFIQEELQLQILQEMQELAELREAQRCRLAALRERLQCSRRPRALSDLSHCRRISGQFALNTCTRIKGLQEWYEPRMLALLRRRQVSEDALRKSREMNKDLKTYLSPLKEETRRLELQRDQLLQRIKLKEEERRENQTLHTEAVSSLEDKMREVHTAIQIQIHTNRELAELLDCLAQKSTLYRRCLGYSEESDMANEETENV